MFGYIQTKNWPSPLPLSHLFIYTFIFQSCKQSAAFDAKTYLKQKKDIYMKEIPIQCDKSKKKKIK